MRRQSLSYTECGSAMSWNLAEDLFDWLVSNKWGSDFFDSSKIVFNASGSATQTIVNLKLWALHASDALMYDK